MHRDLASKIVRYFSQLKIEYQIQNRGPSGNAVERAVHPPLTLVPGKIHFV